jgi:hypothetical protein
MSVNAISSIFTNQLDPSSSVKPANTASSSSTSQSGATGQDQVAFSDFLQLIQQLKQLQSTDPAAFKKELTDIASKLKTAAQQETDPTQSSFLNNLADRFQKAADTGDLSALKAGDNSQGAAQAPGGHHHHHHGGGGAPQLTSQTTDTLASIFQAAETAAQAGTTPTTTT